MRALSLRISATVAVFALALFVAGCSGAGTAASTLDQRLLGGWLAEGGSRYTVTAVNGAYELGVVDPDGEVFEVESVTWTDGVLAWTYRVPSTGYLVSEQTLRVSADSLDVQWSNQTGATGTETFVRP